MISKEEYYSRAQTPARERLAMLFDGGAYTELFPAFSEDGRSSAVVAAHGLVNGSAVYAFSQDSTVLSGAVDEAHARKIAKVYDLAMQNGVPVVGVYDSHGAYLDDGAAALAAYSLIMSKVTDASGLIPTVSVICGICSGIMASVACGADLSVQCADSSLYFDPASPLDGKAAAESGIVSICAGDETAAFENVRDYLALMPENNLGVPAGGEFSGDEAADFSTAEKAAMTIADTGSLLELYKGYGSSVAALGFVRGMGAGIIATDPKAPLSDADMEKTAHLVRLCDAYSIPVISIVDVPCVKCAPRTLMTMSGAYAAATSAKITLISGKAAGSVFSAFAGASADVTIALDTAVIAPLDPMTAAEFLYHDRLQGVSDTKAAREAIAAEYAANEGSPFLAAQKGAVADVTQAAYAKQLIADELSVCAGKRLVRTLPKKHSLI